MQKKKYTQALTHHNDNRKPTLWWSAYLFLIWETQEYTGVTVKSEDLGKVMDCWATDTFTHMLAMRVLKAVCALHKIKRILPPSPTHLLSNLPCKVEMRAEVNIHMHINALTHTQTQGLETQGLIAPSRCELLWNVRHASFLVGGAASVCMHMCVSFCLRLYIWSTEGFSLRLKSKQTIQQPTTRNYFSLCVMKC